MWILYDPSAKRNSLKKKSVKPELKKKQESSEFHAPSSLRKLWFLLDPTGPLSSKS